MDSESRVYINGQSYLFQSGIDISHSLICALAEQPVGTSVIYTRGAPPKPSGTILPLQTVLVYGGMEIDAVVISSS